MKLTQRKRLRNYATDMMNYSYTYIYAPWGSGKSTWKKHIILDLKSQGIPYVECSSFKELSTFFPFFDNGVYLLDDVDDELFQVWETKAHILCFSDKKPNSLMLRLIANKTCLWIDASTLLFTKNEIIALWCLHQRELSLEEADQLLLNSNGWAFALQILFHKYSYIQRISLVQDAYRRLLSEDEIMFLCKLSMISQFDEKQAFFITRNKKTSQFLLHILQTCSFLRMQQQIYQFLPMFQEALMQDMKTYRISKKRYYLRCVDYYQYQHRYYEAFLLLYLLHDFEAIYRMVDACEQYFLDDVDDFYIALCIDVEKSIIIQYPYAYIRFLTCFITYIDAQRGNQYLQEFKAFAKTQFDESMQKKILGEIYICESTLYHHDLPKCGYYNFKAYNMLNGNLLHRCVSIYMKTQGSNQLLFLYYNQSGQFESSYETLYNRAILYNEIINFTNTAYILQLEGEYAYEHGLYDKAFRCANEAIFHVNKEKDVSLYYATLYLLGKSAILKKYYETFDMVVLTLKNLISSTHQVRSKQMLQCIQANLSVMSARNDHIAPWLTRFDIYQGSGIYTTSLQIYITIAKVAVAMQDYETLHKVIPSINDLNKMRHYRFATMYVQLFQVFLIMNTRKSESCEILSFLLAESETDQITSIFLEFSNILFPLLRKLPHTPYLKSILEKMETVLSFQQPSHSQYTMLSKKEYQIFLALREGKSRDEIADLYKISVNTVKFHMKNIYKKLNIHFHRELLDDVSAPVASSRIHHKLK